MQPKFFLTMVVTGALLGGSISASGQSAKKTTRAAGDCSGAWTGVVTYTRSQYQSDHKTVERVSGRGKDTRNWEMVLNYKATVAVVESPAGDGSSVAKASITHRFTNKETNVAVEKNSCDRGKTWQDMTGTFTSESSITGQGTAEADVYVGVNSDGTYSVSVGLPEIDGKLTGSETSTFSGQCTPKPGKNFNMGPVPTKIQGQSLSSDGSDRLDPKNPNRISGSFSQTFSGVTETITWNLRRCSAPLRIIDLKFEDMKFPNWDEWQEIDEYGGTVDGNWVKIKATVLNTSRETKTGEVYFKETYKGDKWNGSTPDAPLKDQSFTVTLEGGEEREVEMLWDSSGYAWFDDGRPRYLQRIKAEVWENFKKTDEKARNLEVRPKPIVFVPGIWTNVNAVLWQNLLTESHSFEWKFSPAVDASTQADINHDGVIKPALGNRSVYDNADNLTTYVNDIRRSLNAWHVDMMAHGTGGLIARLYVHKQMDVLPDGYPVVKHLLMLGTPNNGVSCADSMGNNDAFRDYMRTAKELMPEEIALFNQFVTQRKGTRFSALVGNSVPLLCATPQWNDGFVSVDSAKYGIDDVTYTSAMHPDMFTTETFGGYVRAHVITGPHGTYPYAGRE